MMLKPKHTRTHLKTAVHDPQNTSPSGSSLTHSECVHPALGFIASRVEAIATRLEAIATRLEAIASRLEAIAIGFLLLLGC